MGKRVSAMTIAARACAFLLVLTTLVADSRAGEPITKDFTFGQELFGVSTVSTPSSASLADIETQTDGRYVTVGQIGQFAVVGRLTVVGNLDAATYNAPDGFEVIQVLDTTVANAVALQTVSGQQALVGGVTTSSSTGESDALLFRLTNNGALDTGAFGAPNGFVLISVPSGITPPTSLIQQVVIQPANQYPVAVGSYMVDMGGDFAPFVLRTDASGTLDGSFGSGGIVLPPFTEMTAQGVGVALQPSDGYVLTLSATTDGTGTMLPLVHRFDTTGAADAGFGAGGATLINGFGSMQADDIALQSDESIIVIAHASANGELYMIRLATDGSVDTSFGTAGLLTISFPGQFLFLVPNSLVVNSDGADSIIVVLQNEDVGNSMIARSTADGVPDSTFGDAGTPGILAVQPLSADAILALTAIDANADRIITVGSSGSQLCAIALVQTEETMIGITSPVDASTLTANQIAIYGTSTQTNADVQIMVDGTPLDTVVVTDERGNWNLGVTPTLSWSGAPGTSHTVVANLIYDVDSVIATASATVSLQTP
jgi:uncharacterized delta-60 repeat protein